MLKAGNRLEVFLESNKTHDFLAIVLAINAVVLGMQTSNSLMELYGVYLKTIDTVIIYVFLCELFLRLFVSGFRFFRSAWNVFDFFVIIGTVMFAGSALSVLRALRLFRVISLFPNMKFLISSLGHALPGILNVAIILILMFYVSAIIACQSFGNDCLIFSSLPQSMYSLFHLMMGDNFNETTRKVMETHPYAYLFFIPYIVVMSFTILNLFFGLIVNSMQTAAEQENITALASHAGIEHEPEMTQEKIILNEIKDLKKQIHELKQALEK
jgi:voltage-gated sodium channel